MNSKQTAEELLHNYRLLFMCEGEDYEEEILVSMLSQKCALIAVDEILKHCYEVMKPFWEEVKIEINKL